MDPWPKEHQALLAHRASATTTHIILPQADHLSALKESAVAKVIFDTVDQVTARHPN